MFNDTLTVLCVSDCTFYHPITVELNQAYNINVYNLYVTVKALKTSLEKLLP